jgi:hypothetical protein
VKEELIRVMKEVEEGIASAERPAFEYKQIATALEEIPQAISNRIKRNDDGLHASLRARHEMLPATIDYCVRVAANTWRTILFLCGENMDHGRRVEFVSSVPPLARSILDALISATYIFDDTAANARQFIVSGWGKGMVHYARMKDRYGSDPRSELWLKGFLAATQSLLEVVTLTDQEKVDPDRAAWWPTPGRMRFRDAKRKQLVELLDDLFYAELSGDSHMTFPGLVRRSSLLDSVEGLPDVDPQRVRFHVFMTGLTIFVSLLSEIAGELNLSHEKTRLLAVWATLTAHPDWYEPHRLFAERYASWLS